MSNIFKENEESFRNVFVPVILFPCALLLLTLGRILIRPSIAITAFLMSALLASASVEVFMKDLDCTWKTIIVVSVSAIASLSASTVAKGFSFVLGGATGVISVTSIFTVFPSIDDGVGGQTFLGFKLLSYWAACLIFGLGTGILSYMRHEEMMIILTAVMGSYLFTLSLDMVFEFLDKTLNTFFLCFLVIASIGVQTYIKKRRDIREDERPPPA